MAARRKSEGKAGSTAIPRRRRPSRRRDILRRTAHLFLERGYETTSMVDIVRATGISKAGLYYHFPRKQDLLAAIINLAHDILERDVQKALVDSRDDEDALRRIIHTHARLITREDDAAYAVLAVQEMRSLLPEDRAQIAGRKRAYLAIIRERLESLAAAGRLDGIDPTVATHTLSGMVLWLSNWYRPNGRLPDEEVASQIARLAVNAVLPNGRS